MNSQCKFAYNLTDVNLPAQTNSIHEFSSVQSDEATVRLWIEILRENYVKEILDVCVNSGKLEGVVRILRQLVCLSDEVIIVLCEGTC